MSYLLSSFYSIQSPETIDQGAIAGESQRQRYASFIIERTCQPGTPLPVIPRQMEIVHKPKVAEPNSTSMRGGEWKPTVTSQLFVIFQA